MRQGGVFAGEAEPKPGCLQQKSMLKGFPPPPKLTSVLKDLEMNEKTT